MNVTDLLIIETDLLIIKQFGSLKLGFDVCKVCVLNEKTCIIQ